MWLITYWFLYLINIRHKLFPFFFLGLAVYFCNHFRNLKKKLLFFMYWWEWDFLLRNETCKFLCFNFCIVFFFPQIFFLPMTYYYILNSSWFWWGKDFFSSIFILSDIFPCQSGKKYNQTKEKHTSCLNCSCLFGQNVSSFNYNL